MRIRPTRAYLELMGLAMWEFANYEREVVHIVTTLEAAPPLQPGFLQEYSGRKPVTAGVVARRLKAAIETYDGSPSGKTLVACLASFEALTKKRNSLMHAQPQMELDGSMKLHYYGSPARRRGTEVVKAEVPYTIWEYEDITGFVREVNVAILAAKEPLGRLRSNAD
ncbi:MAG: hypothetical protein OXH70_05675 [Acidobacteria bacterium]|nr:hypothetical protein [Acidobacteriota bacterium]